MNWILPALLFCLPHMCGYAQPYAYKKLGLQLPGTANCTSVKDQALSSTCWSFASSSFLESELKRRGNNVADLSEMFVARCSYLRKIDTHIRLKGQNFFTPGGQFHDVLWVLKHHGMVPQEAYPGLTGSGGYYDHSALDTAIKEYVSYLLANNVTQLQQPHYRYIDSVFNKYFGELPVSFVYGNKKHTAKSFAQEVLTINPDDYVEITSYTHHPFFTTYVLEDKYNWTGDRYYNVPVQNFIAITNHALRTGYTVCWDGDVTENTFDYGNGMAWLSYAVTNYQAERQQTMLNGTSAIDHMMHITATVKDKKGSVWYCVKNSWGNTSNPLGGFMFMSSEYFAIKTTAIIVHKNAVPPAIRKKMGI
jgi:bleomycin hydrolase